MVTEAKAIRNEMAAERVWGMSVDETDHHVRGRLAACAMIQQSLAMQQGAELRNRPRHMIEHEEPPKQLTPIVHVNFGRPDKPEGWQVTDDFPEMGEINPNDNKQPRHARRSFRSPRKIYSRPRVGVAAHNGVSHRRALSMK